MSSILYAQFFQATLFNDDSEMDFNVPKSE